jgi:hypothetical protein
MQALPLDITRSSGVPVSGIVNRAYLSVLSLGRDEIRFSSLGEDILSERGLATRFSCIYRLQHMGHQTGPAGPSRRQRADC